MLFQPHSRCIVDVIFLKAFNYPYNESTNIPSWLTNAEITLDLIEQSSSVLTMHNVGKATLRREQRALTRTYVYT